MADWETVTILRKKPPKASAMKSEQVGMFAVLTYITMQQCCVVNNVITDFGHCVDELYAVDLIYFCMHMGSSFIYLFSIPEIHQSGYRTCHSTINK
jgi:hypothetical protein